MEFVEFMKEKGRLTNGCKIDCFDCKLARVNNDEYDLDCDSFIRLYPEDAERILQEWIEEDRKSIDWSKVEIDTLIEVYGNGVWFKRYFSRYVNGTVYTWTNGATSKTTTYNVMCDKARLVKESK